MKTITWQPGELKAVRTVCELGEKHGFGNLIDRLYVAWGLYLHERHEQHSLDVLRRNRRPFEGLKTLEDALTAMRAYIGKNQEETID